MLYFHIILGTHQININCILNKLHLRCSEIKQTEFNGLTVLSLNSYIMIITQNIVIVCIRSFCFFIVPLNPVLLKAYLHVSKSKK